MRPESGRKYRYEFDQLIAETASGVVGAQYDPTIATLILTACAGFLLAVLWMDLIFDVQVLGHRRAQPPEAVLASIAGYYRRATTTSRPMSYLIAAVMVTLLGAVAFRAVNGDEPGWLIGSSVLLAGGPVALALTRTVPNAVRLGTRSDSPAEQSRLARAICVDHLLCLSGMSAFLVLWLTRGLN